MPDVLFEKKGKLAYITINRPEAYNALSISVWQGLTDAWIRVRDDDDIWVAIVTGTGEKAFSSGQDLKEMSVYMEKAKKEDKPFGMPVPPINPLRGGLEVWKPFIAAINGLAYGGGCELALTCDLRVAAEHATLGLLEVRQGLIPGAGGTQRLPRFMPFGIALEALMTGDPINAQDALKYGLVNRVVPKDKLMSAAETLANRLLENAPLAVRAVKEAAYRGMRMHLSEGMNLETMLINSVFQTEDAKEGPRAFAEKRKPQFKAR